MNQPLQQNTQLQEVHLQDYLNVIFRRRKIFLLTLFTVFLGVAIYTFTTKPVYEATATLHVKDDKAKSGVLGELSLNSGNPVDAEIEIMKSRTNAENVVRRLHLHWQVSKRTPDLKFRLLEFSSTAKTPSYDVTVTGSDTYKVTNAEGNTAGSGKNGVILRGEGMTLLITDLGGKVGDSFHLELRQFNATAQELRKSIRASEVGKKTNIIGISYASTDPEKARDVVNTLVQVYLDQTIAFKTEEASRTVGFVEEQLKGVREELDSAEKNLQVFKSGAGLIQLDAEAQNLIQLLSETEKQKVEIALQRKQIEFSLASLKEARQRGITYSPTVSSQDPVIGAVVGRLTELEMQKKSLISENTENHPSVKLVQGQIDEALRKIQATYETNLKNLTKQEANVASVVSRYEGQLKKLPEVERDLARLTRLSTVNAGIFTFLLQKHEEARIAKASTISNINIVDAAITPDTPVKPKKKKNLALGLLVGLMFGVGLAFFQEYLDDTIKEGEEAKRLLGLPLLALIPFIPKRTNSAGNSLDEGMICFSEPKCQAAEAFRTLRTSVHFSAIKKEKKVLLITSTFPGEGKSTIAANLAITFSQTGAQVVIIDCDMRRPTAHEKFGHSRTPGLTEMLAGDTGFAEAVHDSGIPNLHIISAGTIPPNPAELLGSVEMELFIKQLREKYDHVVIDAPPLLAVTDASVLTPLADLVLLVMEPGRVPAKAAKRVREVLSTVQAPVAGIVMSDRQSLGTGYGYYYGKYGYRYNYGYGYYEDQQEDEVSKLSWWKKILRKL